MKLCTSIAPASMRQALRQLKLVKTDMVEIRVDGIKDLNLEKLLRSTKKTVIITNRRKAEGGKFDGTSAQQFKILSEAAKLGAKYVDVEMHWDKSFISKLKTQTPNLKLIVSYHNLKETPSNLLSIYKRIRSTGADVVKIVTTANDISDNEKIFKLLQTARKDNQKIIGLCMGERGQMSRILAGKYGAFLSFASLSPDEITAPGQLTYDELHNLYSAHTIDARTKIVGLIGNPVVYSKGRYFHNGVFRRLKVNMVYVNFLVDDLNRFMKTFGQTFSGFSVTMPYKEEMVSFLDSINGEAGELGLVNTVLNRNGKLAGWNTDFPAIVSLLKKSSNLQNKQVLVLGTGATSKAMAYAGIRNGAQVTVAGRSLDKAKVLADTLSCKYVDMKHVLEIKSDIVMNGTSVGMGSDESLLPKKYFRKGMVVLDAVYSSEFTPLLRKAKKARAGVITGVELFNEQAKLQSKLFLELMQ